MRKYEDKYWDNELPKVVEIRCKGWTAATDLVRVIMKLFLSIIDDGSGINVITQWTAATFFV